MLHWTPARVDEPELLDMGTGSAADVQDCLADLWRIHRWLGGLDSITRYLYPRLRRHTGAVTLLDMGTGAAQIPAAISQWAARQGLPVRIAAVDVSARNLHAAQAFNPPGSPVRLVQADVARLPFRPGSADYVISSLFLHHFPPEQVVDLLRSAYRLARRGVIMSDVVRGRLALLGFRVSQPLFARSYLTRHDGLVSIRRAYTPPELLELARAAGLAGARVYRRTPWQMTLVADRDV